MPILKYTTVHTTPKAHLKYILNPDKNEELKFASVINTSTDYELAYEDFKELFERFDDEDFNCPDKSGKKQHIRIHSYVQSFDGTVTAKQAHEIGVKWVKEMFGENRPVVISTHINTGHIHNHIAVCPYDTEDNRWLANKKSLALGRHISDKISREMGVSVIENPCRKNNMTYAEWLARRTNTSWKVKMADDIDVMILSGDVTDINSLIEKMRRNGHIFTDVEKLIAKPKYVKYGCRFSKLGYGYSREMLENRIANKEYEMLGRKFGDYFGIQIEMGVYLKIIQYEIYRASPQKTEKNKYYDLCKSCELLCYLSENNIHSKKKFEEVVNSLDQREKALAQTVKWNSMGGSYSIHDFDNVCRNREKNIAKLAAVREKKKKAAEFYTRFLNIMESDYERILRKEKAKREIELYRQGYEITPDGKPYIDNEYEQSILQPQKQNAEYGGGLR